MKRPKISVVIPVYNAGAYLERSLLSLLNQTYNDFEICLVDDCSTDNSVDIIKSYVKRYNNIHYKVNDKNLGCGLTRRKAIEMASGEYISFLDADDYFDSTLFADIINIFNDNPKVDIVIFGSYKHQNGEYIGQDLAEYDYIISNKEQAYREYMNGKYILQYNGNKIYKKEIIDKHEYCEFRFCEDSTTTYKWLYEANEIYVKAKSYYHYWMHNDSNSNHKNDDLTKSYDTVRCIYDHICFCREKGFIDLIEGLFNFMYNALVKCIQEFDIESREYKEVNDIRWDYVKFYKNKRR